MKEKKNVGLIFAVVFFIIISLLFGGYIVYDKIVHSNDVAEDKNYKIKIENLTINDITINEDTPNNHLTISGNLKISYDENVYFPVMLSGYCVGSENEKYFIFGPSGAISYYNSDTELRMVETINSQTGDVRYSDGTLKMNAEVDWKNVKIKSCKIDKISAYLKSDSKTMIEITLDYEKNFG